MQELSPEFAARAPHEDEAAAVVELLRACEEAEQGEAESTLDDLRSDWERARFTLEHDAWIVVAPNGTLAGYADVWDRVPGERFLGNGCVRTEFTGLGLGRFLVRSTERRAVQRAEAGKNSTISRIAVSSNERAGRLFASEGYAIEQHYWEMVLEMATEPPKPRASGMVIRKLERGRDERAVWELVQEAFSDNRDFVPLPFDEWAGFMLKRESFDPSTCFIAEAAGEVIGVALCPIVPETGWVRQLAVRREWRGRGVGRALMQSAFAQLYDRGYRSVGLVVDSFNQTGARDFYESLGMTVKRQHDRWEKGISAR